MHLSVNKDQTIGHYSKCSYENLLTLFVDQHLDKTENLRIQNHLKTCHSCKLKTIGLQNAQRFLKDNIPKKLISEDSLLLIENEVLELIDLSKKALPIENKKKYSWTTTIKQIGTSSRFLRMCFFATTVFFILRYISHTA